MAFNIQILDKAVKSIKKIPEPKKTQIKKDIDSLDQFAPSTRNIKALKGEYKGLYRLRSGDYRILFEIIRTNIVILDIFARQTGY